jgi:hypothetical protein
MTPVSEAQNFTNLTATTTVRTGAGGLTGIFCASASATPTIKVADNATTIVNTFTPIGGTFYPMPARFSTSLVVTISGTVDCTAFWAP